MNQWHLQVDIPILKLRIHAAQTLHILKEISELASGHFFQAKYIKSNLYLKCFVCAEMDRPMQMEQD